MTNREQAEELSGELADRMDAEQREHAVNMLAGYLQYRTEAAAAKRQQDMLAAFIKDYLLKHPEEVLWDGEKKIEARLQDRALPGREYDLTSLAEADPFLFRRLLEMGCLQVNESAVKVQKAQVGGVEKYAFPKGVTKALLVEVKQ